MRSLLILIGLFYLHLVNAQNLNSFSFEKKYKSISVATKEVSLPVSKDTVKVIDTVYLQTQTVQKMGLSKLPRTEPTDLVYSPLNSLQITSNYGMRFHPIKKKWIFHAGVDFGADQDTVKSVVSGIVHSSGHNNGLGYYVKVESGNYVITYGHLSQFFHLEKEEIKAGQPLGITGNTGLSTGEHLHFSVHRNGDPIDPLNFLKSLAKLKSTLAFIQDYEKRDNKTISN